jgi:hypothetical protein
MNDALPALDLGYAFAPPGTVYVTADDANSVENTLTLVITNRSGAAVEFKNPEGLTPEDALPAWDDTSNPLGRVAVWFPWGEASGDLAAGGDSVKIDASSRGSEWAASKRQTDPVLGVYWTLFPLSKSVFLDVDASISFQFTNIVSHAGTNGTLPEQSWMTAVPLMQGYTSRQEQTAVWKDELSATLTAPATAIPGEQITLRWTTPGAAYCTLSPGDFPNLSPDSSQSLTMPAEASVTYQLTAYPVGAIPVTATQTVTATDGWLDLGPGTNVSYQSKLVTLEDGFAAVGIEVNGVAASADGSSWTLRPEWPFAQPESLWGASDRERIWIMASLWDTDPPKCPIYSSTNGGQTWTTVTEAAPWSSEQRGSAASVVFQDKLWVLGGTGLFGSRTFNTVSHSSDGGLTWQDAATPPWPGRGWDRASGAAVFDDRMWIAGVSPLDDMWFTWDAVTWTQAPVPPWAGQRANFLQLAGAGDALYVSFYANAQTEVWRTRDGLTWSPVNIDAAGQLAGIGAYITEYPGGGVLSVAERTWHYVPPIKPAETDIEEETTVTDLPALDLAYGVEPPGIVRVTVDPANRVENTLALHVANASGAAIEFVNPAGLTPESDLPAYCDATPNALSRVYVWFPWGDGAGNLSTAGDSTSIVASGADSDWAVSNRMSDPELGTYWILFPLSSSVFLQDNESVEFDFAEIVSYLPQGQEKAMTWVAAEPRLTGYSSTTATVVAWKEAITASLSAPASAIPGEQITLTWQTTGVRSCSIDPGGFAGLEPNGSQQVTMPAQASVDYTLTAYPDAGSPLYAGASVSAESGWVDIGPAPAASPPGGASVFSMANAMVCIPYPGLNPFSAPTLTTWTSADGTAWTQRADCPVTQSGAWWGSSVGPVPPGMTDGEELWTIGSQTGADLSPSAVCSTRDGDAWTVLNAAPPWGPLSGASAAVFQGSLWVLGGAVEQSDESFQLTEAVYSSSDGGSTWTQAADPPWRPRWWPTNVAAVFDERLWVVGGWTFDFPTQPIDDAWFTRDGESWTQAAAAPWAGTDAAVALVPTADVLYVPTAGTHGAAAMWQMDKEQQWTAVAAPPFSFWALPGYAGFGPGAAPDGSGVIAVGDRVWRYLPQLEEVTPNG